MSVVKVYVDLWRSWWYAWMQCDDRWMDGKRERDRGLWKPVAGLQGITSCRVCILDLKWRESFLQLKSLLHRSEQRRKTITHNAWTHTHTLEKQHSYTFQNVKVSQKPSVKSLTSMYQSGLFTLVKTSKYDIAPLWGTYLLLVVVL